MTAFSRAATTADLQFPSLHRAPSWGPGLWDKVPTLDGDDPDDDTDDSYEYELTTAPDAPPRRRAAGGRDLRWVGWLSLLSAGLVLGGIAFVVWSVVK